MAPTPIMIVGAMEVMAKIVIEALKPEYEVVHLTLAAAAKNEVPVLLKGEVPEAKSSQLGTGNWSVPPRAILFGGAFDDAGVQEIRKAVAEAGGPTRKIPWLHVDHSKPRPQIVGNEPVYGAAISARFKGALNKLKEEGKLDADGNDLDVLV